MPTPSNLSSRGDAYKARNRSLIQLGGLVVKSRLAELLGIEPDGEVLSREVAATLLGSLAQMRDWLQSDPDKLAQRLDLLRAKGQQEFAKK